MKAFIRRHWHHIVLGLFGLIHALTCIFTNLYGDDYYYANFVRQGADYFLEENIFHYCYTNGRALVHLLDELLIGWSFWPWRLFNTALMISLVIVIARIACRSYRSDFSTQSSEYQRAIAATCALLSITDVAVLRQSVYWATGAMNYLLPATAALWFYERFRRDYERERGSWLLLIPAFLVSATTEQASALALLTTICFLFSCVVIRRRAPRPAYWGAFASALVGFCTLYLSPGNAVRTTYYPDFYAMSLPERALQQCKSLISLVFGRDGLANIVCILLLLITVACMKYAIGAQRCIRRTIALALGGESALALGLYLWWLVASPDTVKVLWIWGLLFLPLAAVMVYTVVHYFKNGEIDALFFVWGAVAMQGAMLFSPIFGQRTLIISLICLCVVVVRMLLKWHCTALYAAIAVLLFALLPSYMAAPTLFAAILAAATAVAVIVFRKERTVPSRVPVACFTLAIALAQFSTVAAGYYGNVAINERNRQQIEEYKAGEQSEGLVLYYLPNVQYKYTMPYDDRYHQQMLLLLCGLSPETQVWYEFP